MERNKLQLIRSSRRGKLQTALSQVLNSRPSICKRGKLMSALPEFSAANDPDALETQEWLDALEAVLEREGPERARYLLEKLVDKARRSGAYIPFSLNTAYLNTIPPHLEERSPGDHALEERIRSFCRWNAMVMVAKANKSDDELGGHIASFASVGTLFGIGFNHFWHAPHEGHGGDLVYFQGHSSPGGRPRHLFLSPPVAYARFLAVPHRLDGARADSGYLHGEVPEISSGARARRYGQPEGVGVLRR